MSYQQEALFISIWFFYTDIWLLQVSVFFNLTLKTFMQRWRDIGYNNYVYKNVTKNTDIKVFVLDSICHFALVECA